MTVRTKIIGYLLILLGLTLIILAFVFLVREETITLEYGNNTVIEYGHVYRHCIILQADDKVSILFKTNNTIEFLFTAQEYSPKELYEKTNTIHVEPPGKDFVFNITMSKEYCLLIFNSKEEPANISYNIIIARTRLYEETNSITSITGLVLMLAGIVTLYRASIKSLEEYPDKIYDDNLLCKTISINKHECIINTIIENPEKTLEKIVDYFTKNGYRVSGRLTRTKYIVSFKKKGKFFARTFDEKSRTIIVNIGHNSIHVIYIITPLKSSGTIDLDGVFREVKRLFEAIKNIRIQ